MVLERAGRLILDISAARDGCAVFDTLSTGRRGLAVAVMASSPRSFRDREGPLAMYFLYFVHELYVREPCCVNLESDEP